MIPTAPLERFFLALFLLSTPVACIAVFVHGGDRQWWALANSYGFSAGMIGLYLAPLCLRTSSSFRARLEAATMHWLVWLSCFTELAFQIPHNLFVRQLHERRGTLVEWPFYAYGLSDARWSRYQGGRGLAPEVWLINWNDAGLGALVAALLLYARQRRTARARAALVVAALFRDATLWRETVEYMLDHAREGYPHSTTVRPLRPHAVACLWLVNIVWLVAPLSTALWAYHELVERSPPRTAVKRD